MVGLAQTCGLSLCISASSDSVIASAPAKLNLFLEILGKRPDGYHGLETLMVAVSLYDTLEFQARTDGELLLHCDSPGLPTGPGNLVYQAAERLRRHVSRPDLGASIRLVKRIPAQAGLAGGSSDAAATLVALNQLWQLNLSVSQLVELAGEIGSDVPFFLSLPAAWCTGRGERVSLERSPRPFDVVIVCPPVGLATAQVYAGVKAPASPIDGSTARAAFRDGNPEALGAALFNRLQPAAVHLAPVVENVYRRLVGLNPAGCLMSGSGSAVFALCRDRQDAHRVAIAFRASRPPTEPESRVEIVRTLGGVAIGE